MKQLIIIFSLFLSVSSTSFAQNRPQCKQHREEIKAERVAFITNALSLSVKEAQEFWPIYNDYNSKIEKLRHKKYSAMAAIRKDSKSYSEKEYQDFLDKYIYFIEQETLLKKAYQKDLSKVFSAEKIYTLYKAERDFKRKLVKELRGKTPSCLD